MHYGEIKACDIANGVGVRVSLFVSGCTNRCKNCFQPETWDFNYGEEFTPETQEEIIGLLDKSYISGLSVLGGEPFEPKNQGVLLDFIKKVRSRLPEKNIWVYSGFTFEEMLKYDAYPHCEETTALLSLIDVLVDGRFVEEEKDLTLKFRGSRNQRLIDVKKSLEIGKVVELDI